MDKLGPMARSAEDCALVFEAISGSDPKDPTSAGGRFVAPRDLTRSSLRGKCIGFVREDFEKFGQPEVEHAYRDALNVLKSLGARLEEAKLPEFPYDAVAGTIVGAEAAAAFEP